MISQRRRTGDAPSVAAASDRRGSRLAQNVPTIRTTTATLKKACATRIGAQPRSRPGGSTARNARATTTVGRTNGTTTSAWTTLRPRKEKRPRTYDAGSATTIVSTVDATACQIVNQTISARLRVGEDVHDRPVASAEAALDDRCERIREEHRQEHQRHAVGDPAPGPLP